MLKLRVIPSLLLKDGRMIKTVNFDNYRDVGDPVTCAKVYDSQGADELIFLDITASVENRSTLLDIVTKTAEQCFMPLAVGGGIKTVDDIRKLLRSGADKVTINTAAVENPDLIREAAEVFGNSTIVVSIDVRKNSCDCYEVFTHRAQKATGLDPVEWAKKAEKLGAGEILITAVDCEGRMEGYDLQLTKAVAEAVGIPVIAHGGAGKLQDLADVLAFGKASAVAAASIFHFTDQSPIKAHSFLESAGFCVRTI
ncbi:glycosyl amidation-associated protein WbuZ [Nanoarchaeota archaeon]